MHAGIIFTDAEAAIHNGRISSNTSSLIVAQPVNYLADLTSLLPDMVRNDGWSPSPSNTVTAGGVDNVQGCRCIFFRSGQTKRGTGIVRLRIVKPLRESLQQALLACRAEVIGPLIC